MRMPLFWVGVVLVSSLPASAQTTRVEVTDGLFRDSMRPAAMPYDATGPLYAAIPASATTVDGKPTVPQFRIRSWVEGDGVRVLVSAVTRRDTAALKRFPDVEEQIASIALKASESVEIAATDKYQARRIRVTALAPSAAVVR